MRYRQFQSPMTRLATPIFEYAHPKHFWSAFKFCKSASTFKIISYSICSFFRYSLGHTHLWPCPTKKFSTFNFCDFVLTCKKLSWSINLHWRNSWFKNPAIWLAESIFTCFSGTRFFPIYDLSKTKFFFKFKKPLFLAHFPTFWSKKSFC